MTRDQALIIARRIMDRCEIDRAMHLDAIADEVMAGVALLTEPQPSTPLGSAAPAFARVYHNGEIKTSQGSLVSLDDESELSSLTLSYYLREMRKKYTD